MQTEFLKPESKQFGGTSGATAMIQVKQSLARARILARFENEWNYLLPNRARRAPLGHRRIPITSAVVLLRQVVFWWAFGFVVLEGIRDRFVPSRPWLSQVLPPVGARHREVDV